MIILKNRTTVRSLIIPVSISCISLSFTLIPVQNGGNEPALPTPASPKVVSAANAGISANASADIFYDSLHLQRLGLSKAAIEYAFKGYNKLLKKGYISNPGIISICDFSLSSRRKRLFVIDLENYKLLSNTYVAHGRRSGAEYARRFSNRLNSHESSLGFYITKNTYYGDHGLALKMEGLERGFNDNAERRNIVVHGSEYVGEDFINSNRFMGRSFGCPAIPEEQVKPVIDIIKNGSCFFIYYPTKKYTSKSKILNG